MRNLNVWYCSNDHMIYSEDEPDICKECGSMSFIKVEGVNVSVEGNDGLSEQSKHYHSEE